MLTAIEVHYPVSAFAWERVQELHNRTEPGYNRTYESIKRKFQTIYRMSAPTGDPTIPLYVQRAKAIHRQIANRVDLGGGDEEYNLEENSFGPPQDEDEDEDEDEYENGVNGAGNEETHTAASVVPPTAAVAAAAAAVVPPPPTGLNLRSFNGDEDLLHPQQPLVRRSPHTPRSGRGPPNSLIETIQLQMMVETRQRQEEARERREEDRRRREVEQRRLDEDRRNRNALNNTIVADVGALASVLAGGRVNNNNPVNNNENANEDESGRGDNNNVNE
jgi:hypothetical protein